MVLIVAAFVAVFSLSWSGRAYGQTSCLPAFTALQSLQIVRDGDSFMHPLVAHSSAGSFTSRVQLNGKSKDGILNLLVQFDPSFDGVSLPYNLYAVSVIADGQTLAWYDFTRGCESAGLGFFPGRVIQLPPVKLLGGSAQKLQIMVWGKI